MNLPIWNACAFERSFTFTSITEVEGENKRLRNPQLLQIIIEVIGVCAK